jgi:hypothetical protein
VQSGDENETQRIDPTEEYENGEANVMALLKGLPKQVLADYV